MPILIKGSGGAQEAPVISVSSSGLITATAGDEKTTKQLSSADDADFIASNIKSGVTVFGTSGSLQQYVGKTATVLANGNDTSTIQFSVSELGIYGTDKIVSLSLLYNRKSEYGDFSSGTTVMCGYARCDAPNGDINDMTLYASNGMIYDASVSFSVDESSWFATDKIATITITNDTSSAIYETPYQGSRYLLMISYLS